MPIYEYLCEKCGLEFEREQRISDETVKSCHDCRARQVKRLISQTSFLLKGRGWHSDLYSSAKQDTKQAASGEASPKSTEANSSEPKTEGKKGAGEKAKSKGGKPGNKSAA